MSDVVNERRFWNDFHRKSESEDDDPEEDVEDPRPLHGFIGQNKKFGGKRMNIPKSVEKDCWPNQRCLSKIIIDRIRYALKKLGKNLEDFEEFDFQVSNFASVKK